jgi:hypothetical protein
MSRKHNVNTQKILMWVKAGTWGSNGLHSGNKFEELYTLTLKKRAIYMNLSIKSGLRDKKMRAQGQDKLPPRL